MKTIQRFLVVMLTLGVVSGCGLFQPTLVDQGIITLEIKNTSRVSISSATVYRENNQIVVRGKAHYPLNVSRSLFPGHVDITIVPPKGEIIKRTDVRLIPESIPENDHGAYFISRFSIDPPRGTIINLVYHDGAHG